MTTTADLTTVLDVEDEQDWRDWEPPTDEDGETIPATEEAILGLTETQVTERSRWLLGIRARRAREQAALDAEIARLQARIDALRARHAADIDGPLARKDAWLTGLLSAWALARREKSKGHEKTLRTLYVTVKTTAKAERAKVVDKALALEWAQRQRPDFVSTVVPDPYDVIDAKALAAYVLDTGDIVDGVEIEPATVTAKVDVVTPEEV